MVGPSSGAALELTFRLFELADPRDRLELREVPSGSLLRAFDGTRPPPAGPLRLRVAAVLLTFHSDARGHAQGFALTYRGEPRPGPAPLPTPTTPPHSGLRRAAEHSRGPCTAKGICPDPRGDSWQGQCELQPQACDSAGCNGG